MNDGCLDGEAVGPRPAKRRGAPERSRRIVIRNSCSDTIKVSQSPWGVKTRYADNGSHVAHHHDFVAESMDVYVLRLVQTRARDPSALQIDPGEVGVVERRVPQVGAGHDRVGEACL